MLVSKNLNLICKKTNRMSHKVSFGSNQTAELNKKYKKQTRKMFDVGIKS